jgi:hypothetical protein
MNEFKIQVESAEDVHYVFNQLDKHVKEKELPAISNPQLNKIMPQIMNRVLECIAANSQINGCDWDPTKKTMEEFEPLDESLCKKLEKTISDVDEILVKVSKCRREYPAKYQELMKKVNIRREEAFVQSLSELDKIVETNLPSDVTRVISFSNEQSKKVYNSLL